MMIKFHPEISDNQVLEGSIYLVKISGMDTKDNSEVNYGRFYLISEKDGEPEVKENKLIVNSKEISEGLFSSNMRFLFR